ncbi:MAG: FMN-binding protein [Chitinivibrionales bacterium]|nr:FMN-binding protein [Chitinivibrionales bacterium]
MVQQLLEACKDLPIEERREVRGDYCEMVIYARDMDRWITSVSQVLGEAAKPMGQAPKAADSAITEKFGGIDKNQTLFRKDEQERATIAMFWPWGDGEHVTMKLALIDAPAAVATSATGRTLRKVLIAVAIAIVGIVAAASIALSVVSRRHEEKLANTRVINVDPATLADGTYEATYKVFPVSATVRVLLAEGKIADLQVTDHSHGPGYGAEAIAARVLDSQSLDVDAISGATGSSVVVLKATELALKKAPPRVVPPVVNTAAPGAAESSDGEE